MQTVVVQDPVHEASPGPAVTAAGLVRRYGDGETAVDAVRNVSLEIASGELTAVMGPSGSGKSTLMHLLAGLDRPTSGRVTIAGADITALDDGALTRLRRTHVGFVFQFSNLLPMLTAQENILLPLDLAGRRLDRVWFDDLVERVGLAGRLGQRPAELSDGQRQRVAIARALVARPAIVFADAPTADLDSTTSGEILGLLRESVRALGQTIMMVTHDAGSAATADRVLVLSDGRIVRELGAGFGPQEILDALGAVTARSSACHD